MNRISDALKSGANHFLAKDASVKEFFGFVEPFSENSTPE
jgi:hypothetical protein